MMYLLAAGLFSLSVSAPAMAAQIDEGTVSIANLYVPTVNLTTAPATYTATFGRTFQVIGSGALAGVTGGFGVQNGTLSFSGAVGTTIAQSVANFFTFSDNMGGNYSFSVNSVRTDTFNVVAGATSSISLFLLGTTSNAALGFDPTPTSLTMSLNSTGSSAFSSSATLAIPPAITAVPEPATWAMMLVGFGVIGGTMRRRRSKVTTRVTFA